MVDNKRKKKKKKGGATKTKKYDLLPRTESSMPSQQDRCISPSTEPFTSNIQTGTTTSSICQERYYRSPMEYIGPSPTSSPFFPTVSRPASSMSIQQDSRYCGSPMAMGSPIVFLPNSQVVATPPPYANIAQQQQQQQQPIQSFVHNPQATYPEAQFEMVLGGNSPYNGVDVNHPGYVVSPRYTEQQMPHTSSQGTQSWYTSQVSTIPSSRDMNIRGTGYHNMQQYISPHAYQQSQRQMSSPSNYDEDNHREIATKSWAVNPGKPFYMNPAKRNGPTGANLFIFHIPDDYTNMHLLQLFERFGNLVSVRISIEASTGRGQGFGFVSYDNPESAKVAIQHLHGFQIGDKRLSVQYKTINKRPDSKPEQYDDVLPQEELQPDKSDPPLSVVEIKQNSPSQSNQDTSSVPIQETTQHTQPRRGSSDLGEVSREVTLPTVTASLTASLSSMTPTTPPPTELIELSRSEGKTPSSIESKLSSIASFLEEPPMFEKEIHKEVYKVVTNEVHPSKVWYITGKLNELGDVELRDLLDNPAEMNIKIQYQALQLAKEDALNNIVSKNDDRLSNLKGIEEALPNDI